MSINSQKYQQQFREFCQKDPEGFFRVAHEVCKGAESPDEKIVALCQKHLWKGEPVSYKPYARLSTCIPKTDMFNFFVAYGWAEYVCQEQYNPTEQEDAIYRRFHALQKENPKFFASVAQVIKHNKGKGDKQTPIIQFLESNGLVEKIRGKLLTKKKIQNGLWFERYKNNYFYTAFPILTRTIVKKTASTTSFAVVHPYKERMRETFNKIVDKIGNISLNQPEIFQTLMSSLYLPMEKISADNKKALCTLKLMVQLGEQYEWSAPPELMKLCGYWDWETRTYKLVELVEGCDLYSSYAKVSSDLDSVCIQDEALIKLVGLQLCFNKADALSNTQKRITTTAQLYEEPQWKYPGLMLHCLKHNKWHEELSVRNPIDWFITQRLDEQFMKIFEN